MLSPLPSLAFFGGGAHETEAEKFWKRIPLLGWVIGSILWSRRIKAVVHQINQLLYKRPIPDASLWGSDSLHVETAQFLCATAHKLMGWANDHFIPADPARVVLWANDDGLCVDMFIVQVEDHFGVEFSPDDVERWFNGTLGQLVDFIAEQRRLREQPDAVVWPPPPRR